MDIYNAIQNDDALSVKKHCEKFKKIDFFGLLFPIGK